MKVAILNTSPSSGGAARAAMRLATALHDEDISVTVACDGTGERPPLVEYPDSSFQAIWTGVRRTGNSGVGRLLRRDRKGTMISLPMVGTSQRWLSRITHDCDLIHLHWVNHAFVTPRQVARLGKPVVWTLHDMWPFTGGCHYSDGCEKFTSDCRICPQVRGIGQGLVRANFAAKQMAFDSLALHVVAPSKWLTIQARRSELLGQVATTTIPNPLDLGVFRPMDKKACRDQFDLPHDRKIILFGAVGATADRRKGYGALSGALRCLEVRGWSDQVITMVFGEEAPSREASSPDPAIPAFFTGFVSEDLKLAALYNCADVFVLPSLEENLANTLAEAQACGVPSVAFDIGGNGDLIVHGETGLLSPAFDVADFAANIERLIDGSVDVSDMAYQARRRAARMLDPRVVAAQYRDIYSALLGRVAQDRPAQARMAVLAS